MTIKGRHHICGTVVTAERAAAADATLDVAEKAVSAARAALFHTRSVFHAHPTSANRFAVGSAQVAFEDACKARDRIGMSIIRSVLRPRGAA